MKITHKQFKALGETLEKQYLDNLILSLQAEYPEFFLEFESQAFLDLLLAKRKQYLFSSKTSIEFFAEYMILNGLDFDQQENNPDIFEVLNDEHLNGDEKVDKLYLLDLEIALEDENNA